ncbi:esterase 1 [Auriscalpium vulgare]|uniref:Esterase 1 n=1 Tax=Auriscalpium vulgare TaxID=40419 RepID=A0ACB8SAZ4_9AGAM|nr:esterase 1 [Auriscalpium vulgare]
MVLIEPAFVLSVFSAAFKVLAPVPGPQVLLGNTTIIGVDIPGSSQEFFGGIPFAEPPTGSLRFAPPVPRLSYGDLETLAATAYGPSCVQPGSDLSQMSEDCLTLNIYRPTGLASNSSLPVLVWIYGGSFFAGGTSPYNASTLISQSINRGTPTIYASMNYRLGPLGFPQGDEAASRNALNLGLRDQWTALEWVQSNIAAFGGDPGKVTVFGQSAGAISTALHYLNDNFTSVARAAIMESGSGSTIPIFDSSRGQDAWLRFASNVASCAADSNSSATNTFPCLLSANTTELFAGINAGIGVNQFPFPPVLDGAGGIVSELPSSTLSNGAGARVPFITGTVLDEGTLFVPTSFSNETVLAEWFVANYTPSPLGPITLGVGADILLALYPDDPSQGSPFNTGNNTFGFQPTFKRAAAIFGDMSFQAQRRLWTRTAAVKGTKVYGYLFTDPQTMGAPAVGVAHGSDLGYVYGAVATGTTGATSQLSYSMMDYWLSFVDSLDPNDGKGTPRTNWESYADNQRILELNSANITLIPDDFRALAIDEFLNNNSVLFSQ